MASGSNNDGGVFRPFLRLSRSQPAAPALAPASTVGTLLCATRMRLGKDLQRIAEVLHIRYTYLVAIEDWRLDRGSDADYSDLLIGLQVYTQSGTPFEPVPVPEPAELALAGGFALLAIAAHRSLTQRGAARQGRDRSSSTGDHFAAAEDGGRGARPWIHPPPYCL